MKLLFHIRNMAQTVLLLLVGVPPHAVEPARAGVAAAPLARRRAAEALRLPPARHAGAVRGLPVARAGGPARGRGRHPRARPADREHDARPTSSGSSTSRATRTTGSWPRATARCCRASSKKKAASARVQEELARLAKDHQRIRDIDFFGAPGGAEVRRLEEAIAMRTRRPETAQPEPQPDAGSHEAPRPALGHPAASARRSDRVGLADQALHRSGGDVRLRRRRRSSRRTRSRSTRRTWS